MHEMRVLEGTPNKQLSRHCRETRACGGECRRWGRLLATLRPSRSQLRICQAEQGPGILPISRIWVEGPCLLTWFLKIAFYINLVCVVCVRVLTCALCVYICPRGRQAWVPQKKTG